MAQQLNRSRRRMVASSFGAAQAANVLVLMFAHCHRQRRPLAGDVARHAARIGVHPVADVVTEPERCAVANGAKEDVEALGSVDPRVVASGPPIRVDFEGDLRIPREEVALEQA